MPTYRPSSKLHRDEILKAKTLEDAQVVALALDMQLQYHRELFREMGYWAPHVRELTEFYPFARHVLDCLREPSDHPGQELLAFELSE